jgi:hypothetical protein
VWACLELSRLLLDWHTATTSVCFNEEQKRCSYSVQSANEDGSVWEDWSEDVDVSFCEQVREERK